MAWFARSRSAGGAAPRRAVPRNRLCNKSVPATAFPALACTATTPQERAGQTCQIEDGPALPSETARRLACDGALILARAGEDGSVDYGRTRRVVPAPLRTVL